MTRDSEAAVMHIWEADEDGCVQWWVAARSEEEAWAELKLCGIPSEDTEEFTITQLPDDKPFGVTMVDEPMDSEYIEVPPGCELVEDRGRPRVRGTAGAYAAAYDKPCMVAGTEF
jgi:hypothetical protein